MDKLNIYVPKDIGAKLKKDADMFEVYKKDGRAINMNGFLSRIINGFYDDYVSSAREKYASILSAIKTDKLSEKEKEKIATNIHKNVDFPVPPSRKGKDPPRLSLKPTKETEAIIVQIMQSLGGEDSISQYFCRMLMSYCEMPFSKREQILFKENYEKFQNACVGQKSISFRTIWNPNYIHDVVPYKVVTGPEEMFNYLLCAEVNPSTGEQEAKAYRLNRIDKIIDGRSMSSIDDKVKHYLEMMIQYGPQYAINEDIESCVRLNPDGVSSFNKIYFGRPQSDHVENKGDQAYYYFRCSVDQLFLYFKRFEGDVAEVIYPESLRERIIRFHKETLESYKEG